jgi:rhodanese-related sulfurtransferase
MSIQMVAPAELDRRCRAGGAVDLIDVRTPAEYRAVHAEGARSIPLDVLDPTAIMQSRGAADNEPVYLICQSGTRSRQAAEKFRSAGYENVISVDGGTAAWERAGLAVVRGRRAMSLERQVRIAAGTLVLIGTALGALVHPGFLGLAAFVGAGLVFAGITDTCGMGMLLARMPWNRAAEEQRACVQAEV